MNRIKNFSIEGFKSIRYLELELRQLNVLIGANGAGKSNLIGFFRLLNFLESGALQLHIGEQGGANSVLCYGAKITPQLSSPINFETNSGYNRYHMRLIHAAGDTLIFADEEIQYSKKGKTTEGPIIPLGAGHKESGLIAQSEGKVGTTTTTAKVIRTMMHDWLGQRTTTSNTAWARNWIAWRTTMTDKSLAIFENYQIRRYYDEQK